MITVLAVLIGLFTAVADGATDIRVAYATWDPHDEIIAVVEWESLWCGPFTDEPCYVIVWHDLSTEVGP